LGTDTLKLAQATAPGKRPTRELTAAAWATVPGPARDDPRARVAFFQQAIPRLLADGGFQGRRAVLALPASFMHVHRLRVPPMDEQRLHGTIAWELRGKLPIDPDRAMLRHVIAGEAYQNDEPVDEVIVMAAERQLMDQLLAAATRAKLDVVGLTAEPQATIDCFTHAFAGSRHAGATRLYVDVGVAATRAYVARGPQLLFARVIDIGADDFARAVAAALKVSVSAARELRRRHAAGAPKAAPGPATPPAATACAPVEDGGGGVDGGGRVTALATVPRVAAGAAPSRDDVAVTPVVAACAPLGRALGDELHMCLRYHEHTFPAWPVEQICFVGGEANNRALCRQVAAHLDLPSQIGDPLAKLKPSRPIPALDDAAVHPAWAVAIGLALGTVA
jgi:Tfp pilus assembly PilM family ATPase